MLPNLCLCSKSKWILGLIVLLNVCFVMAWLVSYKYPTEQFAKYVETVNVDTQSRYRAENNNNIPKINCSGVQTSDRYQITSTEFSRASSKVVEGTEYIVVTIETFDKRKRPKRRGGDILLISVKQSSGDGRAAGNVIDHKNGSYTGLVRVFWTGRTNVYVTLASASENTCLRYKSLRKYGDIVYTVKKPFGIHAIFRKNNVKEQTPCNTNNFIYGSSRLCNFTTLNGGMSWFCGHPTLAGFRCSTLNSFSVATYHRTAESKNDQIQDRGHGPFKYEMAVNVSFKNSIKTTTSCKGRSPLESWTEPSPSGYYLNARWEPVNCHTALIHTYESYRSCLKNKTLIVLGDSTVRQYFNFFLQNILELKGYVGKITSYGPNFTTYHDQSIFSNHGIDIMFRKHAMPFYFKRGETPIYNISSFPQILDSLTRGNISDSSLIVLITYHTHFSGFPPEKFRERLKYLAASLKRFFIAKPSAKVFFKGPSPCINDASWFDPYISLLFRQIIEEEFVDIKDKVTYLNVWEINVAHRNPHVHPTGDAFKSLIHQFMSFIC